MKAYYQTAPDVVTFNIGLGFGLNIVRDEPMIDGSARKGATNPLEDYSYYGGMPLSSLTRHYFAVFPEFVLDVQAKFLPSKVVSPLIGLEYMLTSKKVYGFTSLTKTDVLGEVKMHNVKIYLGMTINFWNRN